MKFLATLLLTLVPVFAHAGIYKCQQADGSLHLSDEPCPPNMTGGKAAPKISVPGAPSDSAPSVKINATPKAPASGCGKVISAADSPLLKLMTDEREIARFALDPGQSKDVSYLSNNRLTIMFRVAYNEAMRCKYADGPVGMSKDGKMWMHSYYGGQAFDPVNGKISLTFKNSGDEMVSVVVVAVEK